MTSKLALLHSIVAATHSAGFLKLTSATDEAKALYSENLIEVRTDFPDRQGDEAIARATPAGIQFAEAHPLQAEQTAQNGGNWGAPAGNAPTNFGEQHALNQTTQTGNQTVAQTSTASPAFIAVSGAGFAPSAPVKREGVKRDAPEKYPFGELKAPTLRADGSVDYTGAVVFVPSNKDKNGKTRTGEEMAFSLMSACAAANRRYGNELAPKTNSAGKSIKQYEFTRTFKTQAGVENGVVGAYIYREYKAPAQTA